MIYFVFQTITDNYFTWKFFLNPKPEIPNRKSQIPNAKFHPRQQNRLS
jgi:hypothetical protein